MLKNKNQLLILFLVVGFLIGILYGNLMSRGNLYFGELFQVTTLKQLEQVPFINEEYFWYVVRERVFEVLLLIILASTKWKKTITALSLTGTGFLYGVLMVTAVLKLGIKGILLCVAGVMPQMIFYGAAYSVLFSYWYHYPERKWERFKTFFVILVFGVGILSEVYINPLLIQKVIEFI